MIKKIGEKVSFFEAIRHLENNEIVVYDGEYIKIHQKLYFIKITCLQRFEQGECKYDCLDISLKDFFKGEFYLTERTII